MPRILLTCIFSETVLKQLILDSFSMNHEQERMPNFDSRQVLFTPLMLRNYVTHLPQVIHLIIAAVSVVKQKKIPTFFSRRGHRLPARPKQIEDSRTQRNRRFKHIPKQLSNPSVKVFVCVPSSPLVFFAAATYTHKIFSR